MFNFESLTVYQKAKQANTSIMHIFKTHSVDGYIKDQLQRAALSIVLNIAEGSGHFLPGEKKNFFFWRENLKQFFPLLKTGELLNTQDMS